MKHPAAGDTERIQNLLNKGTENILLCEFTTYPEINSKTDFITICNIDAAYRLSNRIRKNKDLWTGRKVQYWFFYDGTLNTGLHRSKDPE